MPVLETITSVAKRVLGTTNEAMLRRIEPLMHQVRAKEPEMQALDDSAMRQRSAALREKVAKGTPIDAVLVEALALAREAADRRIGMWNAIDPSKGFPDEAWGADLPRIQEVRAEMAEIMREAQEKNGQVSKYPWDIDLPASAYAAVRKLYPISAPPFRMRAHDVQVTGAIVLHQGKIAEMRTGEGKTLVAVMACYLNGISGKGVHVITVNDYLASRDAAWNAPALRFLGVTVGAIQSQMPSYVRKQVYACDVTYGTNNEFGFDYLRDNLAKSQDEQVQTRRHFAIVDEADSVLIDEARTPLIISGPSVGRKEAYEKAGEVAKGLDKDTHYEVDIKDRHVTLNEAGMDKAAELFGVANLYEAEHMHLPHFLDNALKAKELYVKDKEYLISGGQIKIVDEHTGRIMEGRRWSDGLHQAIEAKEGVAVQEENQTYATITLQNFFRLYDKLAGMTGTAMTEANELNAIYKLSVIAIPPNRSVQRIDHQDLIFGTEREKVEALIKEIEDLHAVGQPVLVGTISVEVSERLSEAFTRRGIPHNVLNARQHQREAEIVAGAGQFGAVTIATNMAGRGTDIVLGKTTFAKALAHWQAKGLAPKKLTVDSSELDDAIIALWAQHFLDDQVLAKLKDQSTAGKLAAINKQRRLDGQPVLPLPSSLVSAVDVRALGGLRIVGTERHDSRRIDNQLRGRSGRQGDPGSSRFYLSLDDDLMKRFAKDRIAGLMRYLGLKDGIPIESGMVSNAIEKAQKKVEEYHYGIRKNLLEYDQVANSQRTLIYRQRQAILEGRDVEKTLTTLYREGLDDLIQKSAADGLRGPELAERIAETYAQELGLPKPAPADLPVKDGGDAVLKYLLPVVEKAIAERKTEMGEMFETVLRFVLLDTIDKRWKDHLYAMDHLRHAIGLEAYAQKDPRLRYKEEGFRLFQVMRELIRQDVLRVFFRLQLQVQPPQEETEATNTAAEFAAGGFVPAPTGKAINAHLATVTESTPAPKPKAQPNDPCPCGSGTPYKHCHGR
jgi:preprotein translocase subunit SecA